MAPKVVLDDGVRARVRLLAVWIDDVRVASGRGAFEELLTAAARWRSQHADTPPGQIPGVDEARRLYQAFGVDPTRTRPSSEALLRRAVKGLELYAVNNVVDAGNHASLASLLPLGLYDRDQLAGDTVVVRVGRPGEQYEGIRKGEVHLAGRLTVADTHGPFGSPTSDSFRARVRDDTARLLSIVFAPADGESSRLARAGDLLVEGFARHAGGRLVGRIVLPLP
jgi:DNA/RNA-binding domain of Phe-tRNA-synthetase-like protein